MQYGEKRAKDFNDEEFIKSYLNHCKQSWGLYWNVLSPIEKFGANHFGLLVNIFENSEYGKLFGSVADANIVNILQMMIVSYMHTGEPSIPEDDIKWDQLDSVLQVDNEEFKIVKAGDII